MSERKYQHGRETLMGCPPVPPISSPTRDQISNLGKHPDQLLNLQPFGVWMTPQPTESPVQDIFFNDHSCQTTLKMDDCNLRYCRI